jgi:hypothetical protein
VCVWVGVGGGAASVARVQHAPARRQARADDTHAPRTHPAHAPCRLYESWGFQATPWVDPAWQEEAEKGRTARQRRVMLVKQLSGAGMAAGRAAA